MTHMREEDRASRHKLSACRKGRHAYGDAQNIGAGIVRQVCTRCAEVTIDLTNADELKVPITSRLPKIRSLANR